MSGKVGGDRQRAFSGFCFALLAFASCSWPWTGICLQATGRPRPSLTSLFGLHLFAASNDGMEQSVSCGLFGRPSDLVKRAGGCVHPIASKSDEGLSRMALSQSRGGGRSLGRLVARPAGSLPPDRDKRATTLTVHSHNSLGVLASAVQAAPTLLSHSPTPIVYTDAMPTTLWHSRLDTRPRLLRIRSITQISNFAQCRSCRNRPPTIIRACYHWT